MTGTFYNPVGEAFDPVIVTHQGYYYLIGTSRDNQLTIQKSSTIANLATAPSQVVFAGKGEGLGWGTFWSPVLQFVRGKWYIYFSTTNADRTEWADFVVEGNETDPLGPYTYKATLSTSTGPKGIVGPSVFEMSDGSLYFTTTTFGFYIQSMENPWTLIGERITIDDGSPTYDWEGGTSEISRAIVRISEGGTTVCVPYTTENYIRARTDGPPAWSWAVGMFVNTSGNILNPASWRKVDQPVLAGSPQTGIFQVLAVNVFKSLDQIEDWMVFNALDTLNNLFGDRDTFIQKFTWNRDGTPNFGKPLPIGTPLTVPSGEIGSPIDEAPGSVLLKDNFTNDAQWAVKRGKWSIQQTEDLNHQFVTVGAEENFVIAGAARWGDYAVNVTVETTTLAVGSGLALMSRVQENGSGYAFEIRKISNKVTEWSITLKDTEKLILASGELKFKSNRPYNLQFVVNNELLSAVIGQDGTDFNLLGSIRNNRFAYGKIALKAWGNTSARFSNLTVIKERPTWGMYTGPGWKGIRINSGFQAIEAYGENWVDLHFIESLNRPDSENSQNFVKDRWWIGGESLSLSPGRSTIDTSDIIDAAPQEVYLTERRSRSKFTYVIPSLKSGVTYRVRLHFTSKSVPKKGQGGFNVTIQGEPVLIDFNPSNEAGEINKAVVKEFEAKANHTGHIIIEFTKSSVSNGEPRVSGIEVLPPF